MSVTLWTRLLGGAIVRAVSQAGGFSPEAVIGPDCQWQACVVKAASWAQDERGVELQRREARVTAALSAGGADFHMEGGQISGILPRRNRPGSALITSSAQIGYRARPMVLGRR
jgi:hypothetical protein